MKQLLLLCLIVKNCHYDWLLLIILHFLYCFHNHSNVGAWKLHQTPFKDNNLFNQCTHWAVTADWLLHPSRWCRQADSRADGIFSHCVTNKRADSLRADCHFLPLPTQTISYLIYTLHIAHNEINHSLSQDSSDSPSSYAIALKHRGMSPICVRDCQT